MSIDRGSLIDLLVRDMQIVSGTEEDLADRILALDVPHPGIVLTPEDAPPRDQRMSIDRDDLRMILGERYGREYDITEEDLDDILALDMESGAPATVHGPPQNVRDALTHLLAEEMMFGSDGSDGGYLRRVADRILALLRPVEDGTPAATCNDLRARLANIAELRDEMRTAGGSVVWLDDVDEILDGASPGAALTAEEAADVARVLRGVSLPLHMQALVTRLEAQQ